LVSNLMSQSLVVLGSNRNSFSSFARISNIDKRSEVFSRSFAASISDCFSGSFDLDGTDGLDFSIMFLLSLSYSISGLRLPSVLYAGSFPFLASTEFQFSGMSHDSRGYSVSYAAERSSGISESHPNSHSDVLEFSATDRRSGLWSESDRLTQFLVLSLSLFDFSTQITHICFHRFWKRQIITVCLQRIRDRFDCLCQRGCLLQFSPFNLWDIRVRASFPNRFHYINCRRPVLLAVPQSDLSRFSNQGQINFRRNC
jgi:hypothetical protein